MKNFLILINFLKFIGSVKIRIKTVKIDTVDKSNRKPTRNAFPISENDSVSTLFLLKKSKTNL